MKRIHSFSVQVAAVISIAASAISATSAPATDRDALAAADNAFAFNLLKQISKDQPASNIFISPYSVSTVLQMVCNGASGRTKAEIQQVLGTASLQLDAVNAANKDFEASLNNANTNVILTTANALWYQQGITIKSGFSACNRQFFNATVAPLNFRDPHSASIIDDWASEKTRGKITRVADGLINSGTELFLANAIYFKGKWLEPFDLRSTKDRAFHLSNGKQKQVPMMEQSRKFTFRRGTGYQAVRLEYEGWNIGMYVFLPDKGSSAEKLLGIMTGDTWRRVTEPGFSEREGTVIFPKLRIEYGVEMKRALTALGMKSAFGPADFSAMSDHPLFISAVRQQAFVEVNEEGTEAAAVTGMPIAMGIEMNPPPPFEMIIDRPFLFLIEDKETKAILFMGVIYDPS